MNRTPALDRTVDKVLAQKQEDFMTQIDSAYQEVASNLESSRGKLRSEYEKIIQSSMKQAENLKRQILGSKRLESRNQELILIEMAVSNYFEKARERFRELSRDKEYKSMINEMIDDCISAIGTGEIIIESNEKDSKIVAEIIAKKPKKSKLTLSDKPINVIGGLRAISPDGSLTFDSTIELRMERLKPLIRKEIVQTLRGDR
jgi:V/A-type H+/Na+-transporting ATPase subunit E